MSLSNLLIATKTHLLSRSNFPLKGDEIEILPSPKPPPAMGQRFLSIYGTDWSPGPDSDPMRGLCEKFGIGLTLTFRTAALAHRSTGRTAYVEAASSMEPILRTIIYAIHQSIELITLANAGSPSPLISYLRWQGCDARPQLQGPSWFWADPNSNSPGVQDVGFTMEATFGGVERYQAYSDFPT